MNATREQLLEVEDIGEIIADSILDYFADDFNKEVLDRLKVAGLDFETAGQPEKASDILAGMTIVISGNYSISRDEMKALITANGGKVSGSISGKTTYLLAGEKAGPEKLKKAESLGVKVIGEREFMETVLQTSSTTPETTEEEFKDTLF